MRFREQAFEIGHRAEQRIDLAIVGDVVAEIRHRRLEERRNPDRIDAKSRDVVELGHDARQIADAVAIAVEKAARINLIDHGAAPPGRELPLRIVHALLPGRGRARRARATPTAASLAPRVRPRTRLHTYSRLKLRRSARFNTRSGATLVLGMLT